MTNTIVIDPVTRIEGHSKITIHLDDHGEVVDAQFHVTQFRGFERIAQGRPIHEMPSIMARICGICPVSHLIASSKACDQILAVEPPPTGADLRRVMNLAQIVQSNALSFFRLLLIPVFLVFLLTHEYLMALVTLVVSSATDFVDASSGDAYSKTVYANSGSDGGANRSSSIYSNF